MKDFDFDAQFSLPKSYYDNQLDFLNWFRFYYLFKDILRLAPRALLEVGAGSGILRDCAKRHVETYHTLDINSRLDPDFVGDVCVRQSNLENAYDLVVIADVLEHIDFSRLPVAMENLLSYLRPGGYALITIPHRQSNFLLMTPAQVPHVITVPTGFLSPGAFYRRFIKRKIWIDPSHCWEIGDGTVRKEDVDAVFAAAGFERAAFKKLLYVDYWVLRKPGATEAQTAKPVANGQ